MINNYNDFLLENVSVNLKFKLSIRLKDLLEQSKHPIAIKLISFDDDKEDSKYTLVDFDDDNINNFTYGLSNKILDQVAKDKGYSDTDTLIKSYDDIRNYVNHVTQKADGKYWKINRVSTKIGRFINKLFPKEFKQSGNPGHDLESFTNDIKNLRTQDDSRIKIVKGQELKDFYSKDNYNPDAFAGSTLGGSCMKHDRCQDYIDFYVINNIEMVVLLSKDDDTKIDARAILWTISNIDGDEIERKFMDRIYTIYDYDTNKLIDYAKKQGWLYKKRQNMEAREQICDPKDDTCYARDMRTSNNIKVNPNDLYPYMDTMKFFHVDSGYLTNEETDDNEVYKLEEIDGSYTMEGRIYVEYYEEWMYEDDLRWCEIEATYRMYDDCTYIQSIDEYVTNEYADDNYVYSEVMDEYLDNDDAIKIGDEYVTLYYAQDNYTWSEYSKEWLDEDDAVFSEQHDSYLNRDSAIEVITDDGDDWRIKDDDTYIEYHSDKYATNDFYDNEMDDFILVYTQNDDDDPNDFTKVYKHKEWDKDMIFKWNGRYFYGTNKLKDRITGQKRLWENYR